MAYNEEDYLQLSGIQHFLFCRRQWALIHIENQWEDDLNTVEGSIMHERAHSEGLVESRKDLLIARGLRISSSSLGISGQCDVVEFHRGDTGIKLPERSGLWTVLPIEYKHGLPKSDNSDEAQLCAEAMCLEERLCTSIEVGKLYYGESRHRKDVIFDEQLRNKVKDTLKEMHILFARGYTPKCRTGKWCKSCSIENVCMPGLMKNKSVEAYVREALCENS